MESTIQSLVDELITLIKPAVYVEMNCLERSPEPDFSKVLDFVIAHPEGREAFGKVFVQSLFDPELSGSSGLIQFCMHALRWPELKTYFTNWLANEKSERVRHVLRKIIWSFDDDWVDADFYERYRK